MAEKKHELIIDQHGNIKVEATGFVGNACEETTAIILAGLSASTAGEQKKEAYFETESTGQREREAPNRW